VVSWRERWEAIDRGSGWVRGDVVAKRENGLGGLSSCEGEEERKVGVVC